MSHPPVTFQAISISRLFTLPFTHLLTIQSGPFTHESQLELPNLTIQIHPRAAHNYILVAELYGANFAEPFDNNLANFAGSISTLAKLFGPYEPLAVKHLIQGVAHAMIFFGRQYGYVEMDVEEGVVTATTKRDQ